MSIFRLETDLFDSHHEWWNNTYRCPYYPSATPHGKAAVAIYLAVEFPADGTDGSSKSYRRFRADIANKFPSVHRRLQERGGYFSAELLGAKVLAIGDENSVELLATTASHPHVNQTIVRKGETGLLDIQSYRLYGDCTSERLLLQSHIGMIAGQMASLDFLLGDSSEDC